MTASLLLTNGGACSLNDVPDLPVNLFRQTILDGIASGGRLAALFGCPEDDALRLFSVIAHRDTGRLAVISTAVAEAYPALTPECAQAHLFERELHEQWNIEPLGHPWLKPVRFELPRQQQGLGSGAIGAPRECGVMDFFQVEGEVIHEVAVGPIHAGIIEPGHFRFQCHGESVQHLEISLGYQHRGIERAMIQGEGRRAIHYMETLAGDTTVGHATAYCRNVEALSGTRISARAQVLRGIALELERLANHIGDLGAMAGDIGFLPTQSYCGRIRGDVLNLTALLCGNRFGRGIVRPGGVGCDIDEAITGQLSQRLQTIMRDAESAVELLWNSPSVLARFEGVGCVDAKMAASIGLVGVAARASGLSQDVRTDFPYGIYQMAHIPMVRWQDGDVMARALVRWQEIRHAVTFILEQLGSLPEGTVCSEQGVRPDGPQLAVSLVEGWRGEICHVALTQDSNTYQCYKVVDPSFHNWFGLALALRNEEVSDFPLCNKSFNLSYCGHDL